MDKLDELEMNLNKCKEMLGFKESSVELDNDDIIYMDIKDVFAGMSGISGIEIKI